MYTALCEMEIEQNYTYDTLSGNIYVRLNENVLGFDNFSSE